MSLNRMSKLIVLTLLLVLALTSLSVLNAQDEWTNATEDMVDGTVIEGPREAGPLPEGCAAPEAKDSYLIGFAQANSAEPWRTAMNDQLQAAVDSLNAEMAESGGPTFELVIADAAQDNAKQVADIGNFLTQEVDLLITSPNEASPLTEAVNAAWEACVPVILLDRNITNTDYTMFIGANNVSIGQSAGEYVAEYCAEMGLDPCNVFELHGLSGTSAAVDRSEGFMAGIEGSTATIAVTQNADWLRERAVTVANDVLQANPDIHVIYGHNDPMAEGGYLAAENLGLDMDSILFVGVDALPTADGGIVSVMQGRLGATFIYPTGGQQAIDWAKMILIDHINPPLWVELPFGGVFEDTAQDVCNTYACPLAEEAADMEATEEAS
ncbi:MAG: substrate-binding domain-containing protein [Burkholderiales bacterium]|nr:substrate-binding domain-containing protein [Anaerolineae bacterium]